MATKDILTSTLLKERTPYAQYELVDVEFGDAYQDTEVRHSLQPPTPEHVEYLIVKQAQAGTVYHDLAATRKPWTAGVLRLRSNITGARATLLLSVSHDKRALWRAGPVGVTPAVLAHVHSATDVTSGALEKARQHTQTAYKDEANVFAANNAFTTGLYERGRSVAAGVWQAYTPVFTNLTVGNGALTGRYALIGDTVHFTVLLVWGTTTVITAVGPLVSLPTAFSAFAGVQSLADFAMLDASGGQYDGATRISPSPNIGLFTNALVSLSATSPFTWTTSDQMWVRGTYEKV